DLMHDPGKLNPGADLPLLSGGTAVRFSPMAALSPTLSPISWAGCRVTWTPKILSPGVAEMTQSSPLL
ncbi:hypothetical protein ACC675_38240, partial [Rhizobium ruizarguesonis]